MSGRDPTAPIPEGFRCDYAEPGQAACPAWRCDCFVATHPDDPFGLHPEDFTLELADVVHLRRPDGSCVISLAGQGHLPCAIHVPTPSPEPGPEDLTGEPGAGSPEPGPEDLTGSPGEPGPGGPDRASEGPL